MEMKQFDKYRLFHLQKCLKIGIIKQVCDY